MKNLFFFLAFVFSSSHLFAQATEVFTFEHDGIEREYFLFLPTGYDESQSLPVIFNMHGITSDFGEQYTYTSFFGGFNELANANNFILCFPNGTKIPDETGFEWNVGFSFSNSTADDVGFIDQLIDTLHSNYNINLDRVYATGMSNGGYMALKLACDLTHRFQAVASVTGTMVPEEMAICNPSNTIPVLQIHNTADLVVGYDGFDFGVSIDELLEKWRNENYCDASVVDSLTLPDTDPNDGSTVDKFTWNDCQGNRQVVHFRVNGGAHTWPGAGLIFDDTNQDISASEEIWKFFDQFQTPIAVGTADQKPTQIGASILPNPFDDQLLVQSEASPLQSIILYNALGKKLLDRQNINAFQYQIDQLQLVPGAYYVQVRNEVGVEVIKVIKDK